MKISYRTKYIFAIFDIEGPITSDEVEDLRDHIEKKPPEGYAHIVINLAKVPHIDSSALGGLIQIARLLSEKGITLYLMMVNDAVKRVLKIAGVYGYFKYIRDEESLIKKQSRRELDDFLKTDA